jgi:hypothetical protein
MKPGSTTTSTTTITKRGWLILFLLALLFAYAAGSQPTAEQRAKTQAKEWARHLQYQCEKLRHKAIGELSSNDLDDLSTCRYLE